MNLFKTIRHLEAKLRYADDLSGHDWFKSLKPKQQQEYIKLHPDSKYAPSGKTETAPKKAPARPKHHPGFQPPKPKAKPGTQQAWKRKLYDVKGDEPGDKDHQRMKDIVTKGNGDHDKMMQLVHTMANSIKDSDKARRRGDAAERHLPKEIASEARDVFHSRADSL